jgi:polysaccharide deacetylase 2 family uncharacterized protein YibQ
MLGTACLLLALTPVDAAPARIAIIIDDLGYNLAAGTRALRLPGPVACAILPETPQGAALAQRADRWGKEVLLHLPLQAEPNAVAFEPGGIGLDMSRLELGEIFTKSLASVPNAIGVNNHRGSLLTRHPGHMHWLMQEIKSRKSLFFIDSYTTHESVALALAAEAGVPAVKRDVFLDPDRDPASVEREFARLKTIAKTQGMAVGIGHPYLATLQLLERELPRLALEDVELISISRYVMLKAQKRNKGMQ